MSVLTEINLTYGASRRLTMRVTLGLTRPAELVMGGFSLDWALTVVAFLYSSPHRYMMFSPILGMLGLRVAAPAFTRFAGCLLDSVGVMLSSRVSVREVWRLLDGDSHGWRNATPEELGRVDFGV